MLDVNSDVKMGEIGWQEKSQNTSTALLNSRELLHFAFADIGWPAHVPDTGFIEYHPVNNLGLCALIMLSNNVVK